MPLVRYRAKIPAPAGQWGGRGTQIPISCHRVVSPSSKLQDLRLKSKILFKIQKKSYCTVLNLFYKGAVNAYFLTGSFFKKTVVFEAAIFVGQPEDGAEVRCEVSRRVETAVSRYSGPSALRFIVCSARRTQLRTL